MELQTTVVATFTIANTNDKEEIVFLYNKAKYSISKQLFSDNSTAWFMSSNDPGKFVKTI